MVNCPKCGTPNPDQDTACRACGAPLAGQAFAQALDRASEQSQPGAAVAADTAAAADAAPAPAGGGAPVTPAAAVPQQPPSAAGPGLGAPEPGAAQAEIDQYLKQVKARKARKSLIYTVIGLLVLAGLGFLMYRSSQKKKEKQAAAVFLKAFNDVDNGSIAAFWRCTWRAKHTDVHLSKDMRILVEGVDNAFQRRPKSQPGHIKYKCLPLLKAAVGELDQLKPPDDFVEPLSAMKKQLPKIMQAFKAYIPKMEQGQTNAVNEKRVLEANAAFHDPEQSKPVLSKNYVRLLMCAVPTLVQMAKDVKKAPDVQPLVDHMARFFKNAPAVFADKVRKECIGQLDSLSGKKLKAFKLIWRKFATDNRDGTALKDIFRKANKTFFEKELDGIGKAWVDYRNAVVKVQSVANKYKDEE